MNYEDRRLFVFERNPSSYGPAAEIIRKFASHEAFQSAKVEELVLDDEFYRRAARPEDLSFLDFSTPVTSETVNNLPFLASQRLLFSINEMERVKPPRNSSDESFERFQRFYCDANYVYGESARNFLESFAFSFVEDSAEKISTIDECVDHISSLIQNASIFFNKLIIALSQNSYLEEGVRFVLIQMWSLHATRRAAFARAEACGYFDLLPIECRPRLRCDLVPDSVFLALATKCGLSKEEHSYWQFYLSTSLASCNLLYAFSKRADRALYFIGAAFAAEAEWLALGCFIGQAASRLGVRIPVELQQSVPHATEGLRLRLRNALLQTNDHCGSRGVKDIGQGFSTAECLMKSSHANLQEQLRWISALDIYCDFARQIDARIKSECPNIDRETFVEPREMCSTTHVHDDHRLVVIESGNMVFWGNLGMTLRLAPGEMILVPQGRLHGSSIESSECVYHQPIIPEDWLKPLLADRSDTVRSAS